MMPCGAVLPRYLGPRDPAIQAWLAGNLDKLRPGKRTGLSSCLGALLLPAKRFPLCELHVLCGGVTGLAERLAGERWLAAGANRFNFLTVIAAVPLVPANVAVSDPAWVFPALEAVAEAFCVVVLSAPLAIEVDVLLFI